MCMRNCIGQCMAISKVECNLFEAEQKGIYGAKTKTSFSLPFCSADSYFPAKSYSTESILLDVHTVEKPFFFYVKNLKASHSSRLPAGQKFLASLPIY